MDDKPGDDEAGGRRGRRRKRVTKDRNNKENIEIIYLNAIPLLCHFLHYFLAFNENTESHPQPRRL